MDRSWIRLLGVFGIVFVLFGTFASLYFMDDKTLLPASISQLGLGIILIAVYLFFFFKEALGAVWKNREKLLGVIGGVLVFFLLIGLNVISQTKWSEIKWDLTENKIYSLSESSRGIVKSLQTEIEIVSFIVDPRYRKLFENLASQYRDESAKISYRTLDAKKDPRLLKQYEALENQIVFHNSKTKKNVAIDAGLINEQEFSSAIRRCTGEAGKKIYFLQGHDEPDLMDRKERGMFFAKFLLEREGFEVASLDLTRQPKIPDDASVVVEWGAQRPITPSVVNLLDTWIAAGGKFVLAQSPIFNRTQDGFVKTNLEELLGRYGLEFQSAVVVQVRPNQEIRLRSGGQAEVVTAGTQRLVRILGRAGESAIVQKTPGPFDLLFAQPVNEKNVSKVEGLTRTVVLRSVPETLLDTDVHRVVEGDRVSQKAEKSTGPYVVARTSEKKIDDKKTAQLVVFGTHEFGGNVMIQQGQNADLLLNTFNYLVDVKEGLTIRPKTWKASTLELEPAEQQRLYFASIFVIPMFIILFGLSVWNFRRSRA